MLPSDSRWAAFGSKIEILAPYSVLNMWRNTLATFPANDLKLPVCLEHWSFEQAECAYQLQHSSQGLPMRRTKSRNEEGCICPGWFCDFRPPCERQDKPSEPTERVVKPFSSNGESVVREQNHNEVCHNKHCLHILPDSNMLPWTDSMVGVGSPDAAPWACKCLECHRLAMTRTGRQGPAQDSERGGAQRLPHP